MTDTLFNPYASPATNPNNMKPQDPREKLLETSINNIANMFGRYNYPNAVSPQPDLNYNFTLGDFKK